MVASVSMRVLKGSYMAKDGSVFPGTEREYQIYLPPGFDKSKPAPFMVFQDGVIYQALVVFDNLLAKQDIPPLVGIFIKPGVVPAANDKALPRFNRSYEYDSITPTYSQFIPQGLCVDTNGWLYVATEIGIQACDQAGRVNFIIPTPKPPLDVCFGGKDLGDLFIACGDAIYKRSTKAQGIVSGQMAPIKPPPPKL